MWLTTPRSIHIGNKMVLWIVLKYSHQMNILMWENNETRLFYEGQHAGIFEEHKLGPNLLWPTTHGLILLASVVVWCLSLTWGFCNYNSWSNVVVWISSQLWNHLFIFVLLCMMWWSWRWWWCTWFWTIFAHPLWCLCVPSLFPGCLTIGLLSSCPRFCTWSCSCQSVQIKFVEYQCLRQHVSFLIWLCHTSASQH